MKRFSRRNFLKLMAVLPVSLAFSRFSSSSADRSERPNVILLVLDAMSAYHLSLYGYGRKTTPNFARFAQRANVYHAHYSTANFTIPGTASLLMGLHPWTHRGLHLSGLVNREMARLNLFALFGKEYHRFAFSQNVWATNSFASV